MVLTMGSTLHIFSYWDLLTIDFDIVLLIVHVWLLSNSGAKREICKRAKWSRNTKGRMVTNLRFVTHPAIW